MGPMMINCPQCRKPGLWVNEYKIPIKPCECGYGPDTPMKLSKKDRNYYFTDLREAYNNRL